MHDHMLARRAARWAWLAQGAALRRRRLARFQRRWRRQLRRHRKRGPAARGEGERTVRSAQSRASSSSARAYLGNGARLSGEGQTAGRIADGEARSRSPALPGWLRRCMARGEPLSDEDLRSSCSNAARRSHLPCADAVTGQEEYLRTHHGGSHPEWSKVWVLEGRLGTVWTQTNGPKWSKKSAGLSGRPTLGARHRWGRASSAANRHQTLGAGDRY